MKKTHVIDGFNLFYRWNETAHIFRTADDIARAIELSMRRLAAFLRGRRINCLVVLDGGKKSGKSQIAGLAVQFSGAGRSADEVIQNLVANSVQPGSILVITTDHTLGGNCHALGANTISVEKFIRAMSRAPEVVESRGKDRIPEKLPPGAVQEWLEIFGDGEDIIAEEM